MSRKRFGSRWAPTLLLCAAGLPFALFAAGSVVIYPKPTSDVDLKVSYPVEVLRLALEHSAPGRKTAPTAFALPQSRAIKWLERGENLSVTWTVTSPERERTLRAVPVPIDRGLYGWRVLLTAKHAQGRFSDVRTLPDLARFTGGQGHDWPDLAILSAAGLTVTGTPSYDGLFDMLARGRIDYFPRALPEAWAELEQRQALPLAVEPSLILQYPSAVFFFVAKNDVELAQQLKDGLEAAFSDGSFQALFQTQFGRAIARARLAQRRVFRLPNPLLPGLYQRVAPKWWFDPQLAPAANSVGLSER